MHQAERITDENNLAQIVLVNKAGTTIFSTENKVPGDVMLEMTWEDLKFISLPNFPIVITWESLLNKFK